MAKTATQDKVDKAIAGAAPAAVPNVTFEVKLGSGRGAALLVPANLTPQEAIDLIGMIARDLPSALLQAAIQHGGRMIETPTGLHVVPPT
jgi:hypothetical protein